MVTIIITPVHKERGYYAPGIAITVKDDKNAYVNAKKEAMQLSRLADFPDKWYFV